MKRIIVLCVVFTLCCAAYGQVFKTKSILKRESKFVTDYNNTTVIVSAKTIKIVKWNNGHTEDALLNIDKIEVKPYNGNNCKWYYCTDSKKDELSGIFYKSICVFDDSEKSMVYANFADDVTMYWYKLYFN